MNNGLYDAAPGPVLECRPIAIEYAQSMGELANNKFGMLGAQRACLIASLTLQTIVVSCVIDLHAPGSESGEKQIADMFDAAKRDAIERWHARDLKHHFGNQPRKL